MKFYILLDELSRIGGQVVTGQVIIDVGAPEKTTGVYLKCVGSAEAQTQGHTLEQNIKQMKKHKLKVGAVDHHTDKNPIWKHKTVREQYYLYNILLFGNEDESESELPAGQQILPFSFELPLGIPSSFQGSNGVVQYFVDCRIKRLTKVAYETKTYFEVLGQLDLNIYPGAGEHAEIRLERKCWRCCKNGPVGFSFKLDRSGFVHGENIAFTVNFYNMSSKKIPKTSFQIIQKATFHAGTKKTESIIVQEAFGPSIDPGETKVWTESEIQVPKDIPPSDLGGCNVIGLEYDAMIIAEAQNGAAITGSIPIIIGTMPFQGNLVEEPGTATSSAFQSSQSVVASGNTTAASSVADVDK